MLSSDIQSIFENRLRYLPEITGRAISSVDWATKLIEIGKKHGLHMDDIEELQTVVMKSMVGLLPPGNFEANIVSATALSPASAEQVIAEINNQIINPIHQFVITGGKKPDGLTATGIILEPTTEGPSQPTPTATTPSQTTGSINQGEPGELTLPEVVHAPAPKKPAVSGDFSEFFINTAAQTDHSMIK